MIKAVIDTNVFVSALMKGKVTRPIINALVHRKFQLVTANELIDELTFVLRRPDFFEIIPAEDISFLIALIKERGLFTTPRHHLNICRDPKDNIFVNCAMNADVLVSGDLDLLSLDGIDKLRVITPREFFTLINK